MDSENSTEITSETTPQKEVKRCFHCKQACRSKAIILGKPGPGGYYMMDRDGDCPWFEGLSKWARFWRRFKWEFNEMY